MTIFQHCPKLKLVKNLFFNFISIKEKGKMVITSKGIL